MTWRNSLRRRGYSRVCHSVSKGSPSSRTSSKGRGASAATAGWLMACSLAESLSAKILFRITGKGKGDEGVPVLLLDDRIARALSRGSGGGLRFGSDTPLTVSRRLQELP